MLSELIENPSYEVNLPEFGMWKWIVIDGVRDRRAHARSVDKSVVLFLLELAQSLLLPLKMRGFIDCFIEWLAR